MFWKGSQFNDLYPDSVHINSFKNVKNTKISKKGKNVFTPTKLENSAKLNFWHDIVT